MAGPTLATSGAGFVRRADFPADGAETDCDERVASPAIQEKVDTRTTRRTERAEDFKV